MTHMSFIVSLPTAVLCNEVYHVISRAPQQRKPASQPTEGRERVYNYCGQLDVAHCHGNNARMCQYFPLQWVAMRCSFFKPPQLSQKWPGKRLGRWVLASQGLNARKYAT
jgi:hypothetical protein